MSSSLTCNLCVYFMFGRGTTCSCSNMQQMAQESVTCDSVAKWMCSCSDSGLGPARQFVVRFSFIGRTCLPQ